MLVHAENTGQKTN